MASKIQFKVPKLNLELPKKDGKASQAASPESKAPKTQSDQQHDRGKEDTQ